MISNFSRVMKIPSRHQTWGSAIRGWILINLVRISILQNKGEEVTRWYFWPTPSKHSSQILFMETWNRQNLTSRTRLPSPDKNGMSSIYNWPRNVAQVGNTIFWALALATITYGARSDVLGVRSFSKIPSGHVRTRTMAPGLRMRPDFSDGLGP